MSTSGTNPGSYPSTTQTSSTGTIFCTECDTKETGR